MTPKTNKLADALPELAREADGFADDLLSEDGASFFNVATGMHNLATKLRALAANPAPGAETERLGPFARALMPTKSQPAPAPVQPSDAAEDALEWFMGEFGDLNRATACLVWNFALALGSKLRDAEVKYGYSDNWRSKEWMDECRTKLVEHVGKGDPRDVAAYCAFLWHHGERTSSMRSLMGLRVQYGPEAHIVDASQPPAPAADGAGELDDGARGTLTMIDALRADDGASVTICCDNPEGPPNCAIYVSDAWTGWVDRRFEGETLQLCLRSALDEKRASPPVAHPPAEGTHVFHLTNIRDQVSQDGLADSDYQLAALDAAIAALRQAVPDAVRELVEKWRKNADELGRPSDPMGIWNNTLLHCAHELESTLASQQEKPQ